MWVKGELFDDFDSVRQSARGSLDRAKQRNLFDRLEWFEALWTISPPGKVPLIARARAENCETWLFLTKTSANAAKSLGNWYTLAFRPVFSGDPSHSVKSDQLTALARRLASGLSTISLEYVPDEDGTDELILSAFRRGGWICSKQPKAGSWIEPINGRPFDEYWAARPGETRSIYSKKLKKFGVTTRIFSEFDAKAWAEYEDIYAVSWKTAEGSPELLKKLAQNEGKAGALRLGVAYYEGEPVAAQFWTVENGRALIHKLSYREDRAETSAGTILSHDMFQHVIDQDRVDIIDYGIGDDRYKRSWMSKRNQLYSITLHNPKSVAGLAGAAKIGVSQLVGKLKRR